MAFIPKKVCFKSIIYNQLVDRMIISHRHKDRNYDLFIKKYFLNENFKKAFKFTIVRNPWDRTVSAFHYLQQIIDKEPKSYADSIDKKETFKHYIKTTFATKGVKANHHFHHQYNNAFYKGKQFVDFIGRFENLKEDWKIIAAKINTNDTLPHINASKHQHYKTYYDDECIKIVADIYKQDIKFFGYKF
jgi:hypothetical protein